MLNPDQGMSTSQTRPSAGNLYYVRLKTKLGTFYKLGFTTLSSVHERLSFQKNGDDELIDEVLVFVYRENAYAEEQMLHEHFHKKAIFVQKEHGMPLYLNGQSELYADDILELDFPSRDRPPAHVTHLNVSLERGRRFGNDESEIRTAHAQQMQVEKTIDDLGKTLSGVVKLYRVFQKWNMSDRDRERQARVHSIILELKQKRRETVVDTLRHRFEIKKDPIKALKSDVVKAIRAWKGHDLGTFERIVDVNACARNVVKALTLRLIMGSDFMAEALSCNMVALSEAIAEDEADHQLLLKPIEEAYKRIIREIVRYGRILSKEVSLPDDPRYRVEPNEDGSTPLTLTDFFGPETLQENFGEDFTLPDEPAFSEAHKSVSFNMYLSNNKTGFIGALRIRTRYTPEHKIAVDFPNYGDICEKAFHAAHPGLWHYNQARREYGLNDDDDE